MKIIILGAERVGSALAETLTYENNDINVVDPNSKKLRELQDKIDLRTVHGPSSDPEILKQAGADDADMLIAVTNSDEINLVASKSPIRFLGRQLKFVVFAAMNFSNIKINCLTKNEQRKVFRLM